MPTASTPDRSAAAAELHGAVATLPDPRLPRLSTAARARITLVVFWGSLVAQLAIILTGGAVRLTESGLGCSTWPVCEPGSFAPQYTPEMGIHPYVEFGNRMMSGVVGIFALALLLIALRWLRHRSAGFRWLAAVPLIGTAAQAVVGAFVVWMDLHPGLVSPHFLISMILVAVSVVLLVRLHDAPGRPRRLTAPRGALALSLPLAIIGSVVLVLGTIVTGTGPHSGDAGSITRVTVDALAITRMHAGGVWIFCILLVSLLVLLHRRGGRPMLRRSAWGLLGVTILQGIIGYTQYLTGLPELVVFFHLLGAGLFSGAIAWLCSELSEAPAADADALAGPSGPSQQRGVQRA